MADRTCNSGIEELNRTHTQPFYKSLVGSNIA